MGCASSKHQQQCRHCRSYYTPAHRRSRSMHVHHHPLPDHVVDLTSSTLESIKLDPSNRNVHVSATVPIDDVGEADKINCDNAYYDAINGGNRKSKEFSMGVVEAKTWSSMIEKKIPKIVPQTPIRTPPGEPETIINAWELMEGLEDISPLRPLNHQRSFSFNLVPKDISVSVSAIPKLPTKPLWLYMADDDNKSSSDPNSKSIISDFDPDMISTFKKALEELSPAKLSRVNSIHHVVDDTHHVFDDMKKANRDVDACKLELRSQKDKVVVYITSLRGVRKTYEDCCNVRIILKGSGFRVDERDVSMHSEFKEELKGLLGDGEFGLPRVFVGGRHIGGAEEVRRMHEEGQLEKALEGCEMVDDNGGGDGLGHVCEACGDVRFVPCETCSGSCKVYYDCEDEEGGDEDEYGFRRCPDCNENGLRRCPICCD